MRASFILIYFLVSILVVGICFAGEDASNPPNPIIDGRRFDLNKIPITNARYLNAPKEESSYLLSTKPFLELSPGQFASLTGMSGYSSEAMIRIEVENAEKYCAYLSLWLSEDPNVALVRDRLEAHKNYLAYLKGIPSALRPYLVKTQLYYPQTGNYSIYLRGDILDVYHSSLGGRTVKINEEYLIIFVEKSIREVNVKASVAL